MTENSGYDISSDIMSLTLKEPLFGGTLDQPIHLKFIKDLKGVETNNLTSECVFWDFQLNNGTGGWSTRGCKLLSTDDIYLHCECNHLTNFAVLMRPYSRIQDKEEALNWISIIGCSISIFLSLLTAIIYIFFWKSITVNVNRIINKIIVLLCLSLSLAYTLFLIGVDKIQNEIGCTVITALLHYLFLFIFFLMLALGCHYFSTISLVKLSLSKATALQSHVNASSKVTFGVVTVIPLSITAVTFGIVYSSGKDYHSQTSCWLSFESGALYGFIGPVAGIILVNIIIVFSLILTLYSTISSEGKLKKRTLAGIKSICVLLPVLGVTWLFGLLSINEDVVVFQYIFALLNSFQGLFIFISKCLLNKKIRKLLSDRMHVEGSEGWRSRFYTLLSSNKVSTNTKEFSSASRIKIDGEELLIKQKEGESIQLNEAESNSSAQLYTFMQSIV
ncbi:adhesion G-protein coupled receptor D1-like [Saccostrea cucullata]|uniref:adhesion G-protein coupled receptor D1-like n=1 Tax=Saccostrea cuccullata TaxID=36930 RepID=UPI002ED4D9CE